MKWAKRLEDPASLSEFFIALNFTTQISGSKLWLQERSCMCCQESGEREAVVQLFCPKAKSGDPKIRRV